MGMRPQHFHTIPTSCAILPPLTQICFVFVSCVQRRVVEGSGVGSGGCVVHFDVHGKWVMGCCSCYTEYGRYTSWWGGYFPSTHSPLIGKLATAICQLALVFLVKYQDPIFYEAIWHAQKIWSKNGSMSLMVKLPGWCQSTEFYSSCWPLDTCHRLCT